MEKVEQKTTVVKVYVDTKRRVSRVARRMADQQDRKISDLEIHDTLIKSALPRFERKLGLK